ncbi:MAG TPA: FkbM family methyltransferase [Solirubrobacteraceae bacterium]|nr:FkbM family methyltransferase [Solirubrobacteraceae bacterium]
MAATKSKRAAKLGELKARKKLAGGEVFVDYDWIKLLFSDDGDRQELYYHVNQREWHAKDMAFYSRHIQPGSTVVDVGANMGFVTSMLASRVGPAGAVISFEPSRTTYAKLLKTIAVNELTQVIPHNVGIGATRETLELVSVSGSSGNNTLVPSAGDSGLRHETVEIMPLSDLPELQERKVSLLKIDTEGYEANVLAGAREILSRDMPVIYTELGGGGAYADATLQALAMLSELGYDTTHADHIDWSAVGNGVDFAFFPRDESAVA